MALAMKDMVKGTIVDHRWVFDSDDQTTEYRPVTRRGIIVKVEGDITTGVEAVWVKFKPDQKAEKVPPRELDRYMAWNHKKARQALARLEGRSDSVGGEFTEKRAPIRPKHQDALALTPRKQQAVVEPEEDEVDPMLESQNEPIVIPDDEQTAT